MDNRIIKISLLLLFLFNFFVASGNAYAQDPKLQFYEVDKFVNPYSQKSSLYPKSSLNIIGFSGETEYVFFTVKNNDSVDMRNVEVQFQTPDNQIGNNENWDIFIANPWYQAGAPILKIDNKKVPLFLVPELLIKNDTKPLIAGKWQNGQYMAPEISSDFLTSIPQGEFRFFCLKVTLPEVKNSIDVSYHLKFTRKGKVLITIPVHARIFSRYLPVSKKIKTIYYYGTLDKNEAAYEDTFEIKKQFDDIHSHYFKGITLKGEDPVKIKKIAMLAKKAGVGDRIIIIYTGKSDKILKEIVEAIKEITPEVYVMTVNEPNKEVKLKSHLTKWQRWKEMGINVYAPIRLKWEKKLWNNGQLDWVNYNYRKELHSGLNTTLQSPAEIKSYYWQSYMEMPVLNRYLSGFYLYYSNLDGITPYAYRHKFLDDQPYISDVRSMGSTKGQQKHINMRRKYYYMTYPSTNGPISTLQWEAFIKGEYDLRYCYLIEELISILRQKGYESLSSGIKQDFNDLLRRICQFYPAKFLEDYQKYEQELSRSIEDLRSWIIDTWQQHSDKISIQ